MGQAVTIIEANLIGDALMTTPALRALRQENPDLFIDHQTQGDLGSRVLFEGNPHLSRQHASEDNLPLHPGPVIRMDAAAAFTWGKENGRTITEGFGALLGVDVTDLRYDYFPTDAEQARGQAYAEELGEGKPVVFVARHSASCSSNDPRCGNVANKCISNRHWCDAARWLLKEGFMPVALGSKKEAEDGRYREWCGKKFYGHPIREVAAALPFAAGVLSVDTGIRHLACAVGAHLACLSAAIPLSLIRCVPVQAGQRIHEECVPLQYADAQRIIKAAKQILRG